MMCIYGHRKDREVVKMEGILSTRIKTKYGFLKILPSGVFCYNMRMQAAYVCHASNAWHVSQFNNTFGIENSIDAIVHCWFFSLRLNLCGLIHIPPSWGNILKNKRNGGFYSH